MLTYASKDNVESLINPRDFMQPQGKHTTFMTKGPSCEMTNKYVDNWFFKPTDEHYQCGYFKVASDISNTCVSADSPGPSRRKKTFKPGAVVYVLFIMYVFTGCLVRLINQNYACSKH